MPFKFSPGHCGTGDCGCGGCLGCPSGIFDFAPHTTLTITVRWIGGTLCLYTLSRVSPCRWEFGTSSLDISANPPVLILDGCTLTFDATKSDCITGVDTGIAFRWTRGACRPCGNTLATEVVLS